MKGGAALYDPKRQKQYETKYLIQHTLRATQRPEEMEEIPPLPVLEEIEENPPLPIPLDCVDSSGVKIELGVKYKFCSEDGTECFTGICEKYDPTVIPNRGRDILTFRNVCKFAKIKDVEFEYDCHDDSVKEYLYRTNTPRQKPMRLEAPLPRGMFDSNGNEFIKNSIYKFQDPYNEDKIFEGTYNGYDGDVLKFKNVTVYYTKSPRKPTREQTFNLTYDPSTPPELIPPKGGRKTRRKNSKRRKTRRNRSKKRRS